jgi:hypothetical protein
MAIFFDAKNCALLIDSLSAFTYIVPITGKDISYDRTDGLINA